MDFAYKINGHFWLYLIVKIFRRCFGIKYGVHIDRAERDIFFMFSLLDCCSIYRGRGIGLFY